MYEEDERMNELLKEDEDDVESEDDEDDPAANKKKGRAEAERMKEFMSEAEASDKL